MDGPGDQVGALDLPSAVAIGKVMHFVDRLPDLPAAEDFGGG
jgi:hypothetical protein